MISGTSILIIIVFLIFFVVYKWKTIAHFLTNSVSRSTRQFQDELELTADRVIGKMENQIVQLEYLLTEADEKITELDKKIKTVQDFDSELREKTSVASTAASETDQCQFTGSGSFLFATEAVVPDTLNKQQADGAKIIAREPIADNKRQLILAMAGQGYSVTEIAKATGMGKGAIMLLLQLNKK